MVEDSEIAYSKRMMDDHCSSEDCAPLDQEKITAFNRNMIRLKLQLKGSHQNQRNYWPIVVHKNWPLSYIRHTCSFGKNDVIFQPFNYKAKLDTQVGTVKKGIIFASKKEYNNSNVSFRVSKADAAIKNFKEVKVKNIIYSGKEKLSWFNNFL